MATFVFWYIFPHLCSRLEVFLSTYMFLTRAVVQWLAGCGFHSNTGPFWVKVSCYPPCQCRCSPGTSASSHGATRTLAYLANINGSGCNSAFTPKKSRDRIVMDVSITLIIIILFSCLFTRVLFGSNLNCLIQQPTGLWLSCVFHYVICHYSICLAVKRMEV